MKVHFSIPGMARGKERARTVVGKDGRSHSFTPKDTVAYENLVKIAYKNQCGDAFFQKETPLDMRVYVYVQIPKSASKRKAEAMERGAIRPTKKPDSSNVLKSIEDALNGVAYYDDSQIVDSLVRRYYAIEPRTVVEIQEASVG